MNSFNYQYPVRQHFGKGCAENALKEEMKKVGKQVLLAYGGGSIKRTGLYDKICQWLEESGKEVVDFGGIMPNPTYAKVQEGARIVRDEHIDFILAVGGGSVIDCCKIVSSQAMMDVDAWDDWYVGHNLPKEFVPMGAVVTASGTGAEQNNGAVITNEEKKLKQPLFGAFHSFAILDSDLTKTLPMKQVISGAFDTSSHCMETYMGKPQSTNVSDEVNEAVMRNVIKNIHAIIADPAMAENGLLKLGKVTDFQCHMIEHAVGAYTDCNHGQGLAILHPTFYRHLLNAGTAKLARMAQEVWGVKSDVEGVTYRNADAAELRTIAEKGIAALEAFIKEIGLPTHWSEIGITDDAVLRAASDTCFITPGCCKQMSRNEIFELLKECK